MGIVHPINLDTIYKKKLKNAGTIYNYMYCYTCINGLEVGLMKL